MSSEFNLTTMTLVGEVDRAESRPVFATLVRLLGDFDLVDESLHEAFAAAQERWKTAGAPENPRACLVSSCSKTRVSRAVRRSGDTRESPAQLHKKSDSRNLRLPSNIFANLPVKDLQNSTRFYEALGYQHHPQFTDETAACIVISDTNYVMLLTHAKFKDFTAKDIADATKVCHVLRWPHVPARLL